MLFSCSAESLVLVFVSVLRGQTKKAIDFVGEPQPNRVDFGENREILGKIRCKSSDFGGHLGSCDAYCLTQSLTFTIVV